MPQSTQLGVKKETTWGTAVVVDRFYEYESESITPTVERVEGTFMRAGTRGMREDRFIPYVSSYTGAVKMPVLTKTFGLWLEHMLGTVASGSVSDSTYTHTGTIATLCGKGLTVQVNRPLGACGDTDQAFTFEGGKVADFTLSCEQGGYATFEANMVFEAGTTATALATASYVTGMELMPFGLSSLTVGGSQLDVKSWSVKCNNGLATDRKMVRSSYQIKEPIENARREVEFTATCDFEALADVYNRAVSSTASGALAAVVITTLGPTLVGATTYPGLVITMDKVRFDSGFPTVGSPDITEIQLTGKALVPVSGNQLSVAFRSSESTP